MIKKAICFLLFLFVIIMAKEEKMNNEVCCPKFNPEPWNEKEIKWENKKFVVDQVKCFLHIPLNMTVIMKKNMALIEKANAMSSEMIILEDPSSLWKSNIYISVSNDVPNTKMITISGIFITKVFEGPYKNAEKWCKEMKEYVKSKGKEIKKIYFYYTTCPKCAKKYGKNYVVILAQI